VNTASYADITSVLIRVLVVVLAVATGACAARGGTPRPRPFPGASLPPVAEPSEPPEPVDPGSTPSVVRTALDFLGVPYRNGGSDPSGFDCSGLVQYVFARHGFVVPREVRDQYRVGREIDLKDAQPGDLIFFETVSRGASHVGMVIGEGRFVHAPSSRGVVRIEAYVANYWSTRIVGARRIVDQTARVTF
jgi:cell wall-associated NlpC family hydrolase